MNLENFLSGSSESIPVILGPTASGKTGLAIEIAERIGGEIISADSMQIYQEMNIGTAKPTVEEQERVPHHLIDFVSPDTPYSVSEFRRDAIEAIEEIRSRGRRPVICGGTGLYISSLIYPFDLTSENTDAQVRKQLEERARKEPEELYRYLQMVDPISAEAIHPNNLKRIIRALEIYEVTGKPKSVQDQEGREKNTLPYEFLLLTPDISRENVYERIDRRVDAMIEKGLLEECRTLLSKYSRDLISMQAIGYKELYPYIDGEMELDEAVRILKRDTRHFAKRQLTWFRRFENVHKV